MEELQFIVHTNDYARDLCLDVYTVQYNTVQYDKILYTALQWRGQNTNQGLNLRKTEHISASYAVSFARFSEKINYIIMAPKFAVWSVFEISR